MAEQSLQANSEEQQPSIEDRVLSLLEPGRPENEEQEEEEAPQQAEDAQDSQEQLDAKTAEQQVPEAEEVEFEGEKFKIPAKLKDAFLRQQDYTKKTQEAAEVRRTADSLMQQAQQVAELQKGQSKLLGKLASIDDQIAQYEKVDWNALTAQNAAEAQKHFIAFSQLKDQRSKAIEELNSSHRQQMEAAQKAHFARLEEGQKALARDIKGWNPEMGQKLMGFAQKAYGFTPQETSSVNDPRNVQVLHDAYQWRQLQASKPALEKRAPANAKTLRPQASEARTPGQQETDTLRRQVRNAKTDSERNKPLEQLVLRKLR